MKTYNLERFLIEHQNHFSDALNEIKQERKQSHWMWFMFPQMKGLGRSYMADYYGMEGIAEAKAFYDDCTLGKNIQELLDALLETKCTNPIEIFGFPDDLKLCSSMTLFAKDVPQDKRFVQVLEKFYNGKMDKNTLEMI